jgi:hypothetical protein
MCASCATKKYGCKNELVAKPVINYNYSPKLSNYRGHGYVDSIDINTYYIRIYGILLKNDTIISPVKFVLVYGNGYRKLRIYKKSTIYFEFKATKDVYTGVDILEITNIDIFDNNQQTGQANSNTNLNTNSKKS